VKDVADYAGQLFNELKEHANWIAGNREALGDFSACLLLLQLLVRARQLYEDIVYFLTTLMLTGAVRATARIYMVEADKQLIESLAGKGLIDPGRAEDAKTILETEAQKIYERWTAFKGEFSNALANVKDSYIDALNYIKEKYENLNCNRLFSV